MKEIYKINNFTFNYPYQKKGIVIDGDISIFPNDIVLLSGDSGSGKTTLLYALKGLIPNFIFGKMSGKIEFMNRDITTLSMQDKLKIGLLFQNPDAQMINRKVINELALGLENLKMSRNKMKDSIYDVADKFNITNLLKREITTLSGGEKQKIALLSIILTNPEIILFDEPTAFLDPDSAVHFISTFKKIIKNKTIVVVEHNLYYLKSYVSKVINIKNHFASIVNPSDFEWDSQLPCLPHKETGKTVLEVKNLCFKYRKSKIQLLQNINLRLKKGEIISIIGKNGAGKTTLLKLIAKIIKPNKGEIVLNGKTDFSIKEYYKKITLLRQNPENHFLFKKVKDETSSNNLNLFGLSHLAENNPFTLSEGEKRRLSLAIAFNNLPDIFLLDEPTFGQDPKNKIKLIRLIDELKNNGKSLIIVSHDYPFVKAVSDRIIKLENGTLYENQ